MAATRTAAKRASREVFEGNSSKLHVDLSGLTRTALPNDLRRLCGKSKAENVSAVAIEYRRFRPTGHGLLTFTRPEHAASAHKALDGVVAGGKRITARLIAQIPDLPRSRGKKGLLEAAERGAITGDGPGGGITGGGRNVVLSGLPGRLSSSFLADNLRGFKLAGSEFGKEVVIKLGSPEKFTATSRFLVRASSVSEAYRMVRKFHMQPWRPDMHGDKCITRASVVW